MTADVLTFELEVDEENPTAKWTALSCPAERTHHIDPRASVTMLARASRIPIRFLVSFEIDSCFYVGLSENLSEGGVFIATRGVGSVGSRIDLGIMLPDQEPLRARGTIVWQRLSTKEALGGMGIQFDGLPAHERARIRELAEAQEAMESSSLDWEIDSIL